MPPRIRLYLWPYRALYVGHSFDAQAHRHHAAQLALSLDRPLEFSADGQRWTQHTALFIPPDVLHAVRGGGERVAMLYLDRESSDYQLLLSRWGREAAGAAREIPVEPHVRDGLGLIDLEGADEQAMAGICDRWIGRTQSGPTIVLDERVAAVLKRIEETPEETIPLRVLARAAHLSPTRLSHLFREKTGIALRSFLLWRRLRLAVEYASRGGTLTEACIAAGFADSAHFTRTFKRTFGVTPSFLFGNRSENDVRLIGYPGTLPGGTAPD